MGAVFGGSSYLVRWASGDDGFGDDDDDTASSYFPNERIPLTPTDGPLDLSQLEARIVMPSYAKSVRAYVVALFASEARAGGFLSDPPCEVASERFVLQPAPCSAAKSASDEGIGMCVPADSCTKLASVGFSPKDQSAVTCANRPDSTLTCCPFERTASAGFRADEGELKSGALRVAVAA